MTGERLAEQGEAEVAKLERKVAHEMGNLALTLTDDKETEQVVPDAKAEVVYWSNEYNEAEQQFAQYSRKLPEDKAEREDYRTTVVKYEKDIAYIWQRVETETNKAMSEKLIRSPYELADTQGLGVVDPHETVEAATGIFYDDRIAALNSKVLAAEPTKETEAEQRLMRQTWRKVMDYVETSTDYDFLHRDYDAYHRMRRTCHNSMIQQLNALNLLAEKYSTTRFTPRNFMTNDFDYNGRRDRSGKLNQRANYDRETVLAYFQTVFQEDFSLAEKKAQRLIQKLRPGMVYRD